VAFEAFVAASEPPLRRALCAAFGAQVGREAVLDALAYAWEHWARISTMTNPVGYLYRVGETAARRQHRSRRFQFAPEEEVGAPEAFDPAVVRALRGLSPQQRTVVVMVHGYGYSLREVAAMMDLSFSTVRNHLTRGMARLRSVLEVDHA
jgi:RNA polymerase sigma-70 factor (ECF subfamily)